MSRDYSDLVGQPVFVMARLDSITYLTGELVSCDAHEVVLTKHTWHRSTGRHHQWVAGTHDSDEREQYPEEMIVRLRRSDVPMIAGPWKGKLNAGSK